MACNCNNVLVSASSVTTTDGVTTITVPSTVEFANRTNYCIALLLPIPAGTNGTQINITNGKNTYSVMNNLANYWRPCCALQNRNILRVRFLNDPDHLLKV